MITKRKGATLPKKIFQPGLIVGLFSLIFQKEKKDRFVPVFDFRTSTKFLF